MRVDLQIFLSQLKSQLVQIDPQLPVRSMAASAKSLFAAVSFLWAGLSPAQQYLQVRYYVGYQHDQAFSLCK